MVELKEALRKEFGTSALEPDIRLALCLTAVMSADASPPLGMNRVYSRARSRSWCCFGYTGCFVFCG